MAVAIAQQDVMGSERSRRVERREPRLAHSESPPTFSRGGCCHTDLRARGLSRAACLAFLVKRYAEEARLVSPQHRRADGADPSVSLVVTSALGWSCTVPFEGWAFDRRGQIWAIPPSTKISLPVMKRLSSEARKLTTFATSEGAPFRPIGAMLEVWAKKPANWVSSRPTSR
jgi:hypothetical protein